MKTIIHYQRERTSAEIYALAELLIEQGKISEEELQELFKFNTLILNLSYRYSEAAQ